MVAVNMSLINDALKKARKAQPAGANADAPDLLPVEAATGGRGGSIFTLPFIIAVVLVLAGVMLWAWYRSGQVMVVRGNSSAANVSAASRPSEPRAKAAPTVAPAKSETATTVTTASTPTTDTSANAGSTNVLLAATTEPPKPAGPVYKLEGIFYSAKKPSAVINGDLVHVGSRVEAGQVVAIDEESATVVTSAGETNLLVLTR
jgi:biotin carboxyl carrier protein